MRKKIQIEPTGPLIVNANEMVEASYRLSLQEQRLILYMASLIKPDETDFRLVRIPVGDLARILGIDPSNIYRTAPAITAGLRKKELRIAERGSKRPLQVGWVASADYREEGVVELEFSQKLKPYLLQLKERFTAIQRQHIMRLGSVYAIRIYQLLKQYQSVGWRRFNVNELRDILGVRPDEYPLYGDFKKRVLMQAQRELTTHGDIRFQLEEHKTGRKVTAVTFHIETNMPEIFTASAICNRLTNYFLLTPDQAQDIMQQYPEDTINEALAYVTKQVESGNVANLAAFTLAAVRNGWRIKQSLFELEKKEKDENAQFVALAERKKEKISQEYQRWFEDETERIFSNYPDEQRANLTAQAKEETIREHGDGIAINIMTKLRLRKIIAELEGVMSQEQWESKIDLTQR